jgi:hypothetical protein
MYGGSGGMFGGMGGAMPGSFRGGTAGGRAVNSPTNQMSFASNGYSPQGASNAMYMGPQSDTGFNGVPWQNALSSMLQGGGNMQTMPWGGGGQQGGSTAINQINPMVALRNSVNQNNPGLVNNQARNHTSNLMQEYAPGQSLSGDQVSALQNYISNTAGAGGFGGALLNNLQSQVQQNHQNWSDQRINKRANKLFNQYGAGNTLNPDQVSALQNFIGKSFAL